MVHGIIVYIGQVTNKLVRMCRKRNLWEVSGQPPSVTFGPDLPLQLLRMSPSATLHRAAMADGRLGCEIQHKGYTNCVLKIVGLAPKE